MRGKEHRPLVGLLTREQTAQHAGQIQRLACAKRSQPLGPIVRQDRRFGGDAAQGGVAVHGPVDGLFRPRTGSREASRANLTAEAHPRRISRNAEVRTVGYGGSPSACRSPPRPVRGTTATDLPRMGGKPTAPQSSGARGSRLRAQFLSLARDTSVVSSQGSRILLGPIARRSSLGSAARCSQRVGHARVPSAPQVIWGV